MEGRVFLFCFGDFHVSKDTTKFSTNYTMLHINRTEINKILIKL